MEKMVVRGEMRGVVVGRNPGPTHAIRPRGDEGFGTVGVGLLGGV